MGEIMKNTNAELDIIFNKYNKVFEKGIGKNSYSTYFLKKKSGKLRKICQPEKILEVLQRDLLPIIKRRPVSKYCMAYENGCSVKKNAKYHSKAKHILHIDIKNFFSSINSKMFEKFFCKNIEGRIAEKFWEAVSLDNGLPIGSPTSPFIANRVMYEIDKKLGKLSFFTKYSRYADDMVFSSKREISVEFIKKITDILNQAEFEVNQKKTYFMSYRKEVTGIIIHNKMLSTGTSFKKKLKNELYDYLVKGIGRPERIRGKFAFLSDIEPKYAKTIKKKYAPFDAQDFLNNI